MKLYYENKEFKRLGRTFNIEDETDMEILCNEINTELQRLGMENELLRTKLNIIMDVAERQHG